MHVKKRNNLCMFLDISVLFDCCYITSKIKTLFVYIFAIGMRRRKHDMRRVVQCGFSRVLFLLIVFQDVYALNIYRKRRRRICRQIASALVSGCVVGEQIFFASFFEFEENHKNGSDKQYTNNTTHSLSN